MTYQDDLTAAQAAVTAATQVHTNALADEQRAVALADAAHEVVMAAQRDYDVKASAAQSFSAATVTALKSLEAAQLVLDDLRAHPPLPPPAKSKVKFGMTAGADTEFAMREAQTGRVHARRKFVSDVAKAVAMIQSASQEKAAGHYAVFSSKFTVPWADVPKAGYRPTLDKLVAAMKAEPVTRDEAFFAFEHEPQGNSGGTGPQYAAAQAYAIKYLADRVSNWRFGVILNGFPFSPGPMHQTDSQIAAGYMPDSLVKVINDTDSVLAADCYHGGSFTKPLEGPGPKIVGMSAWATRKGVRNLGIGEYNGLTAAAITAAQKAITDDPRYVFACIYNSDANNRADLGGSWVLDGDRLAAFKAVL